MSNGSGSGDTKEQVLARACLRGIIMREKIIDAKLTPMSTVR